MVNIALIKIFPSEDRYPRCLRGEQGGVLGPIDGAAAYATELTVYLAAYRDTLARDNGRPPPVRRPVVDPRAS